MLPHRAIHPVSFLAGIAIVGVGLLLASPAATSFPTGRFVFGPHPRDFVTVREGLPFVVPAGSVFVPVVCGSPASSQDQPVQTRFDGIIEASAYPIPGYLTNISTVELPRGLAALPGQTVSVTGGATAVADARLWGYLAPATSGYSPFAVSPGLDYVPRTSALVKVDAGFPLAVPVGKVFVLTALGMKTPPTTTSATFVEFAVDGTADVRVFLSSQGIGGPFTEPVPTGVVAPSGSTVSVSTSAGVTTGVAWGYLADV